ncbi:cysteine hydrolase [Gracilibacillus oryzae]|uniref:Cysteine hydrolase n=1 Tax=Gracilibacillus oryzae TaxID=1672701 RepID=A0A7C8GR88_9BACI|nr:isochorismatase family cysteine hydrolase [Gracilibacillus oryzae]KAB8126985.1 cysteine hydrolase [Gracilibacillus oryzae]
MITLKPEETALIVVDVQNDFCHEDGSLAKTGANLEMVSSMMPPLKNVIEHAKEAGVSVIYIQTIHEESTDSKTWTNRFRNKEKPAVCRKGSWGSEFYEINPQADDIVVIKHRYSAFINTRLESVLKTKGIKSLLMTGISTNVCVESTARDGFMLDYQIVLLEDCCASFSRKAHEMTLINIRDFFGNVATSDEIFNIRMPQETVARTL